MRGIAFETLVIHSESQFSITLRERTKIYKSWRKTKGQKREIRINEIIIKLQNKYLNLK